MKLVFAGLLGFVPLEEDYSSAFVSSGEVVAGLIELDGGDYVGLGDVLDIALVTEASA